MNDVLSYARLFLGFSKPLSGLILKYSGKMQPAQAVPLLLPITILSSLQINRTLEHPHNHYIKSIMKAHAERIRIENRLIRMQEILNRQRIFLEESLSSLAKKRTTTPAAGQENIKNAVTHLENQYKALNNMQDQLNQTRQYLAELETKFDSLTAEYDQEWTQYREQMLQELLKSFERFK